MIETKAEKIVRVFLATITVTFIGLLVSLAVLQEEPWLKNLLQERIEETMHNMIKQEFSCKMHAVNLLTGEVILTHVNTAASDGTWQFSCPRITIKFSLADLLFKNIFNAQILVDSMYMHSQIIDKKLAIQDPISLFLEAPSTIPFKLRSIAIRRSCIELIDRTYNYEASVTYSCDTTMLQDMIKTTISLHDGYCAINNKKYMKCAEGSALIALAFPDSKITVQSHISMIVPDMSSNAQKCTMHFAYRHDKGSFSLASADETIRVNASDISFINGFAATYTAHIHMLAFSQNKSFIDIQGNSSYKNEKLVIQSSIVCNGLPGISGTQAVDICINQKGKVYDCAMQVNNHPALKATISSSALYIESLIDISLKQISIAKGLSCNLRMNSSDNIGADIKGAFLDSSKKSQDIKGHFTHNSKLSSFNAQVGSYEITSLYDWNTYAITIRAIDAHQNDLINVSYDATSKKIKGIIAFRAIKKAMKYGMQLDVPGEGALVIDGIYKDNKAHITTHMQKATIRVPYTYNTIKDIVGDYYIDIQDKKLLINSLKVSLNTGQIEVSHGACYFNEYLSPYFALVTARLHNCLGNWQKMFFGLFSGYVTWQYGQEKTKISGDIVIDKAQLKNNILSPDVQKSMLIDTMRSITQEKSNVYFDIHTSTYKPAKLKTLFLEAQIRAQLSIRGTFDAPHISGVLSLNKGLLSFPYKPLYITEGKIYLNPEQLVDSSIEIIAKNTIKKYAVQMHVAGSLQVPHITFSSSPMLQEEQILTLLLAGSPDGSLIGAMPNVLMQGLEKALFSNADTSSEWLQSVKNFLKPLSNIRINPTISDQQGSMKGGIAIDVNDRLRASISNNLDLTDETSVELEYALSDGTTLRGARDDKGSISGEIEMRWKF